MKSGFFTDQIMYRAPSFLIEFGVSGDPAIHKAWQEKRCPMSPTAARFAVDALVCWRRYQFTDDPPLCRPVARGARLESSAEATRRVEEVEVREGRAQLEESGYPDLGACNRNS